MVMLYFFFNDTATTEIYTLSLHDALPIWVMGRFERWLRFDVWEASYSLCDSHISTCRASKLLIRFIIRSEEHTSELQSQSNLVCRLLLEKKKKTHVLSRRIFLSSYGLPPT